MTVRVADAHEAEELLRITNAAYQVEKFFIDTDRLDPERLGELLLKGVFLVTDGMAGCVYVELRGERAYFGPLSVDPARQGSGPASYWSRRRRTMPARTAAATWTCGSSTCAKNCLRSTASSAMRKQGPSHSRKPSPPSYRAI